MPGTWVSVPERGLIVIFGFLANQPCFTRDGKVKYGLGVGDHVVSVCFLRCSASFSEATAVGNS
jgi:hypothetical protein